MKTTRVRITATALTLFTVAGIAPALASESAPSVPPAASTTVTHRWQTLPATPTPTRWAHEGHVAAKGGAKLYYAEVGKGSPVILLHGGPANSDYLARQVEALKSKHRVIVIDTRGHGRSTLGELPLGYDLFADDVVAVMQHTGVGRADFVGWSDGGITALDLAMRYPSRVGKVLAFGANISTEGTLPERDKKPALGAFLTRAEKEYKALSSTPNDFAKLNDALATMYSTQPDWTDAQLRTIKARVLIMDGDHDEAIARDHTRHIARTIPNASLRFLHDTSHFAFLQDTATFNRVMTHFIR